MSGSVQYMAITPRVKFSADLAEAVIAAATVPVKSERRSSFRAEDLSVGAVWARRDNTSTFGQMRRAPTLALVKALRLAHDDAPDPVLWPTPKEALEGRRATKQRRGGSRNRGDRNHGDGNSGDGGGQTGEKGGNSGGGGHHNRRGAATVVDAWEERRVLVVAHGAAKGATRPEPTGAAAAAREEAPEYGGTAHEGLQRGTARQPPPARL